MPARTARYLSLALSVDTERTGLCRSLLPKRLDELLYLVGHDARDPKDDGFRGRGDEINVSLDVCQRSLRQRSQQAVADCRSGLMADCRVWNASDL